MNLLLHTQDLSQKRTILKRILLKWTGSENIDIISRGSNIVAQELAILEKFMGKNLVSSVVNRLFV